MRSQLPGKKAEGLFCLVNSPTVAHRPLLLAVVEFCLRSLRKFTNPMIMFARIALFYYSFHILVAKRISQIQEHRKKDAILFKSVSSENNQERLLAVSVETGIALKRAYLL